MSMRKQFVKTLEERLSADPSLVLLLGDIGVFGFKNAFQNFPDRVLNIGILEQATVGLAAGLAKTQLIPVVHTIAPFLVERSFEQLKIDFGYQRLGGNFVSVGASYDYASLGCTHHCPGDVAVLQTIPGMEIVVPGTAAEFDTLFKHSYANGNPTYFRLSERENAQGRNVTFGKAEVIQQGTQATVVAVGPALQAVVTAASGLDVTVLYYTTLAPFDAKTFRENLAASGQVLLVEPFYTGTLTHHICASAAPRPVCVTSVGVPHAFLTHYGTANEHDKAIGLTPENIRTKIQALLHV